MILINNFHVQLKLNPHARWNDNSLMFLMYSDSTLTNKNNKGVEENIK
jgi:hypothetical protein